MKLVTGTTPSEFYAFVNSLASAGFTKTVDKTLNGAKSSEFNYFYRFLSPKKEGANQYVLMAYYLDYYK